MGSNFQQQIILTQIKFTTKNSTKLYIKYWCDLNVIRRIEYIFLAHLAKGHVSFCHHLASVVRPSVRPSYVVNFNLLLRNHWANCNQTLVEWYLYGPLPKLCLLIATSNQDGRQAKNRKKGG